MQIQVNTDNHIHGRDELVSWVEGELDAVLSRFSSRVTRVEVHLGDDNAGRSDGADKRCVIEARPAGQQPVAVTHHAGSVRDACSGAAHKLANLLGNKYARSADHKGGESIRTMPVDTESL